MGYQESWLYIEPQHKFKKLIQAYEKAEQSGYYEVAGAEPHSVIVLKQPFGDIPAGKKLLWVCGDRGFHCAAGVFGGELKCSGRLRVIPVEEVLDGTDDPRMEGLDFDSPAPSENAYMKRYSVANYAHTQDKPRLELTEKIEANFYSQDLTPAAPQPRQNEKPAATKISGKEILEAIRLMDADERKELTRALFA